MNRGMYLKNYILIMPRGTIKFLSCIAVKCLQCGEKMIILIQRYGKKNQSETWKERISGLQTSANTS